MELLAVLIISSLLLVLAINILFLGQKNYSSQTASAEQLTDIRYATKTITKEVRRSDSIKASGNQLVLINEQTTTFKLMDKEIVKNGSLIASGIGRLEFSVDGRILTIEIDTENPAGKTQTVVSEIHLRDGVVIE